MKEAIARLLHESADQLGVEIELRSTYSGRGMFGRKTYAIVISDFVKLFPVIAHVGSLKNHNDRLLVTVSGPEKPDEGEVVDPDEKAEDDDFKASKPVPEDHHNEIVDYDQFVMEIGQLRSDSLGRDIVLY